LEVAEMAKKARLGLYLTDEEMKRRIKVAAARKGLSTTAYCEEAIREHLLKEGEIVDDENLKRRAFIARIEELRREIGPLGILAAELVKEGRRR
jgi:hypothetical protein